MNVSDEPQPHPQAQSGHRSNSAEMFMSWRGSPVPNSFLCFSRTVYLACLDQPLPRYLYPVAPFDVELNWGLDTGSNRRMRWMEARAGKPIPQPQGYRTFSHLRNLRVVWKSYHLCVKSSAVRSERIQSHAAITNLTMKNICYTEPTIVAGLIYFTVKQIHCNEYSL